MSGVLVSGATTPLGQRVVTRLLAAGHAPVLAVGAEPPEEAQELLPDRALYRQVDLTRPRFVRRLLHGPVRDHGIATVVHLAAHRQATQEGRRVHALNVGATRLMLRLAEDHPTIERFVHHSTAHVYANRTDLADVLREDAPLDLSPGAPQWVRDRVEADVTVCTRMGLSPLRILVLRCAEILAPDSGSQLWDYLASRVCLRPLGYDPLTNVLSLEDAARAFVLAVGSDASGVFNIPGRDVLPLSRLVRLWGRNDLPVPGPLVGPVYRLRQALRHADFRYDLNRPRFHLNATLDGGRAAAVLGYRPEVGIAWPTEARRSTTPRSTV